MPSAEFFGEERITKKKLDFSRLSNPNFTLYQQKKKVSNYSHEQEKVVSTKIRINVDRKSAANGSTSSEAPGQPQT